MRAERHTNIRSNFPCLFFCFAAPALALALCRTFSFAIVVFLKSKYKKTNIEIVVNEQLFDTTNSRHEGKPYDRQRLVGETVMAVCACTRTCTHKTDNKLFDTVPLYRFVFIQSNVFDGGVNHKTTFIPYRAKGA